jgi:hypothetical protein
LTPSELALAGTVETTATMTATGPGLWAWLMQKALPNNPSCDATKRKGAPSNPYAHDPPRCVCELGLCLDHE